MLYAIGRPYTPKIPIPVNISRIMRSAKPSLVVVGVEGDEPLMDEAREGKTLEGFDVPREAERRESRKYGKIVLVATGWDYISVLHPSGECKNMI